MPVDIDPLHVVLGFAGLAVVLVVEAIYLLLHDTRNYRSRVNRRLTLADGTRQREAVLVQLRRERGLAADGNGLSLAAFRKLIVQSGLRLTPARIALAAALLSALPVAAIVATHEPLAGLAAIPVAFGLLPLFVLMTLRKIRHGRFAGQFPQAIDIIVRSLRAGYPVPAAIGMVARELPDPVGSEFGMMADEITYGADLETAMRAMMVRVGQEDLPLFVTSVSIQSTTGGNLSEILENLSKVIRERFKMRRKIKGLSSEGKVSAMILNSVPFLVFISINAISPDFYGDVWSRPSAPWVLGGCLGWMVIGNLMMWRMINFKF